MVVGLKDERGGLNGIGISLKPVADCVHPLITAHVILMDIYNEHLFWIFTYFRSSSIFIAWKGDTAQGPRPGDMWIVVGSFLGTGVGLRYVQEQKRQNMQGVKLGEFFTLRRSYEYNIYKGPQVGSPFAIRLTFP